MLAMLLVRYLAPATTRFVFCVSLFVFFLTLSGHIKTAEQLTIIQQYGDWYTGR